MKASIFKDKGIMLTLETIHEQSLYEKWKCGNVGYRSCRVLFNEWDQTRSDDWKECYMLIEFSECKTEDGKNEVEN